MAARLSASHVGIVLAAGESRRAGRCKALAPFGSTTLLGEVVGCLRAAEVARVCVVVGGRWEQAIQAAAAALGASTCHNPHPEDGMMRSLLCGLDGVGPDTSALVALVDHPGVHPSTVHALQAALAQGAEAALPTWQGSSGHPVALGAACIAALRQQQPPRLDTWLDRRAGVVRVPVDDSAILTDVDTLESLAALRTGRQ